MGDCNCSGIDRPGKTRCKQSGGSWDNFLTQLPSGPTRALDAHLDPVLANKEELVRDAIIRINNSSHTHIHKHSGNGNKR